MLMAVQVRTIRSPAIAKSCLLLLDMSLTVTASSSYTDNGDEVEMSASRPRTGLFSYYDEVEGALTDGH